MPLVLESFPNNNACWMQTVIEYRSQYIVWFFKNQWEMLTWWDLFPSMLTTNPTPQASLSNLGSYSPVAGGNPYPWPSTVGMVTRKQSHCHTFFLTQSILESHTGHFCVKFPEKRNKGLALMFSPHKYIYRDKTNCVSN